jgi:3-dehydroquinate synthase
MADGALDIDGTKGNMMQTVPVELGNRSYDIHIGDGLLQQSGAMIASLRPGARVAIVTDGHVGAAHGAALQRSLDKAGIAHVTITLAPGEATKSMAVFAEVVNSLLAARLERNDLVIAFGGGVIGDLAGFAAAVTRRGMDFVQIPTSLLAQVDSSVGGKTGINAAQGKNLIGAFHQPVLVIADTALLKTLPPREFRAGYAEVVKYGLIDRPQFFHWLQKNRGEIFAFGPALQEAVATACRAKAEVVAADETETGARALLNLGHTFGHALEAATRFDSARLVHGEGVAIGMVLAHEFSNRLNLCDADTVETVRRHLAAAGLPTSMAQIPGGLPPAEALLEYITQDKKVKRGRLTFILTKGLGQSYIADDVPPSEVLAFLNGKLEA